MSLSSITTTTQSANLALISGSGQLSTASVSDVAAQGQGTDQAQFSKGAQMMSKLASLASTDQDAFKKATQEISDKLSQAAGNAGDSEDAKRYTELAEKFATAAKTGTMDSLAPPQGQQGPPPSGDTAAKVAKFNVSNDHQAFFNTLDTVIGDALSGVSASTA